MASIVFDHITKQFDETKAVDSGRVSDFRFVRTL